MSSHLAQLERAGLLRSRRDQRRIIYAVDLEGIRRLLVFLMLEAGSAGGRERAGSISATATP